MEVDTLARLRVLNLNRVELFGHKLHDWNPLEWAGCMCGEAGEAANIAKKLRRIADGCRVNTGEASEEEMIRKLGTEIAGTLVYADLLAASVGLDLRTIIIEEFDRVSKRVNFPTPFIESK
jgi:hypothetical protein